MVGLPYDTRGRQIIVLAQPEGGHEASTVQMLGVAECLNLKFVKKT